MTWCGQGAVDMGTLVAQKTMLFLPVGGTRVVDGKTSLRGRCLQCDQMGRMEAGQGWEGHSRNSVCKVMEAPQPGFGESWK